MQKLNYEHMKCHILKCRDEPKMNMYFETSNVRLSWTAMQNIKFLTFDKCSNKGDKRQKSDNEPQWNKNSKY